MIWFSDSKNCPDKKKSGKLFPNAPIGNPLISSGFPLKASRKKRIGVNLREEAITIYKS